MSESTRLNLKIALICQGRRLFLKQSIALLGTGLYGCGGGSSSESPPVVDSVSIQAHPADQTVDSGDTAAFQVVATGSPPLNFQWQRDGVDIPGATQAAYVIGTATTADDGATFRVQITNPAGTTTSSAATLRISAAIIAPSITSEPADSSVSIGQATMFAVSAAGSAPLSYQWRRNGVDIQGATGQSHTVMPTTLADNRAEFSVVIANQAGSLTSRTATLNIISTGTTIDTTAITIDTTAITIDEA